MDTSNYQNEVLFKLSGTPASNKPLTESKCVVITDPNDHSVFELIRPGTVIVAKATDPSYAVMMMIAGPTGGIVTEQGGILSHAAVVAREIGMSAMVGVSRVTELVSSGMTLGICVKEKMVIVYRR